MCAGITVWEFVLASLVGYGLGAIPSGVIVARTLGRPDPRSYGSRHTGGSNVARRAGLLPALFVLLVDAGKGIVAGALGAWLAGPWGLVAAGVMAIIGHCWSMYAGWHGGMGLSTAGGLLFWLAPAALVLLLFVWLAAYSVFRDRYRSVLMTLPTVPLVLRSVGAQGPLVVLGTLAGLVILARFFLEGRRFSGDTSG